MATSTANDHHQQHIAQNKHEISDGSGGDQQQFFQLMQVPTDSRGVAGFVALDPSSAVNGQQYPTTTHHPQQFVLQLPDGNLAPGTQVQFIAQPADLITTTSSSSPSTIYLHNPALPQMVEHPQQQPTQTLPVQMLTLGDGTAAFIPISVGTSSSATSTPSFIQLVPPVGSSGDHHHQQQPLVMHQPQLLHTVDGQTIELVAAPPNAYHHHSQQNGEVQIVEGGTSSEAGDEGQNQQHNHFPTTTLITGLEAFSHPVMMDQQQQQVEPVYVNEKQYARILKRRAARVKLEMEGRIPKQRRKYLHESRHRHAQNRARRAGGKFDSGQLRAESSASQQEVFSETTSQKEEDGEVGEMGSDEGDPCKASTSAALMIPLMGSGEEPKQETAENGREWEEGEENGRSEMPEGKESPKTNHFDGHYADNIILTSDLISDQLFSSF